MSWVSDLFSSATGGIVREVKELVDNVHTSDEERQELKVKLENILNTRMGMLQAYMSEVLAAQTDIVTAELKQGDNYTKRARPTIVYFGLVVIAINYVLAPIAYTWAGLVTPELSLPPGFWAAWGGVSGTYAVGRSMEKAGVSNRFTRLATGNDKNR